MRFFQRNRAESVSDTMHTDRNGRTVVDLDALFKKAHVREVMRSIERIEAEEGEEEEDGCESANLAD